MTTTRSTSSKIQALILSLWTSRKLLRGPALWRARRLCLGAESIRCVCLYVFEILGQVCSEGSSFCQVGRKRKAEHPLASTPSEAAPPVASEPAVHAARPPSLPHSWSAEFGAFDIDTCAAVDSAGVVGGSFVWGVVACVDTATDTYIA